jgi:hypothetical protein
MPRSTETRAPEVGMDWVGPYGRIQVHAEQRLDQYGLRGLGQAMYSFPQQVLLVS